MAAGGLDPVAEIWKCEANPLYFIWHYCTVKDEKTRRRVPFRLWPEQADTLKLLWLARFVILLKARQIGMTTLVVCFAVWLALFRPGSTILIFSKTQREAKDMLKRIKSTLRALPEWLQPAEFAVDATQELELSNGSRFITFASRGPGGDSYTATLVIIDEADLIPNLNELLEGAEPTIAADGRMILLSRTDKKRPTSAFKQLWRAATAGDNDYKCKFIPWDAAPWRTEEWYHAQRRQIESRTGSLDDLYSQYPKTADEALAPRELDRRFLARMVLPCFKKAPPLPLGRTPWPGMVGLRVFELPKAGLSYMIGGDTAKGNPNSDDSTACVVERAYQRQVAVLQVKLEPGELAQWIARLAAWYNRAGVLVERNHEYGQHCISSLANMPPDIAPRPRLLIGRDKKWGFWTDRQGKRMMYDHLADAFRCGSCTVVDEATYNQIISLDSDQLEAPYGEFDDLAVAYGLAVYACSTPQRKPELTVLSYDRPQATMATDSASVAPAIVQPIQIGSVEVRFFGQFNEWWAIARRDGHHIDLYGHQDKAVAEAAAAAADALLASPGPVPSPLASDPLAVQMHRTLAERGWIRTC